MILLRAAVVPAGVYFGKPLGVFRVYCGETSGLAMKSEPETRIVCASDAADLDWDLSRELIVIEPQRAETGEAQAAQFGWDPT